MAKAITLAGEGPETVLRGSVTLAAKGAALEGLAIDAAGEGTALLVREDARVSSVQVHNDRGFAVKVLKERALAADGLRVACLGEAPGTGIWVAGSLEARELAVEGACQRGLDVQGGTVRLAGLSVEGARDAGLRGVDATISLERATFSVRPVTGVAGLFCARCELTGSGLSLKGGEHGALLRGGNVDLTKVSVTGAARAGVAFVQGRAHLAGVELRGPFSSGAVMATDSPRIVIDGLTVEAAGAAGLLAVRSLVTVAKATVSGARCDADGDFGHAFSYERGGGELRDVTVRDAGGGVLWAHGATVRVERVTGDAVEVGFLAADAASVDVEDAKLAGPGALGALACGKSRLALERPDFPENRAFVACTGSTLTLSPAHPGLVRGCDDQRVLRDWKTAIP